MVTKNEMLLDAKIDMKDGSRELHYLRTWVKCYVKIEAIECFPCYIKVSFFNSDETIHEHPIAIVRINIPGIRVEPAASRTKTLAYGVFWKNNRKRCKMFFAFDERQQHDSHMKWLKNSIDSLEDYRKKILESHRISRVVKADSELGKALNTTITSCSEYQKLNEGAQLGRNMQDVLGPLPAIPSSIDNSTRWSIRRISGYSGIYEEILEPIQKNSEFNTRDSVTSGIYVDMTTPIKLIANEIPPPLPPRRRYKNQTGSNKDCNCNMFIQNKVKSASTGISKNVVNKNMLIVPKTRSVESNLSMMMSIKQNSFSTPDLTTISNSEAVNAKAASSNPNELDDNDLDVMDIERSNSLNTSTLARPVALNISSNILWSHNLSATLSSNCDPSAINLVGANVNDDRFLREDLSGYSGYCQMAPIMRSGESKKTDFGSFEKTRTSTRKQIIEDCYCAMAPINTGKTVQLKQAQTAVPSPISTEDITTNTIFDCTYNDDTVSYSDFSLLSINKHSTNRISSNEENSSSGVSSDEGAAYTNFSLKSMSPSFTKSLIANNNSCEDDVISLTCTESSVNSPISHPNESTFSTKFDEKYPSYYPNDNIKPSYHEGNKYTVTNNNNNKSPKVVHGVFNQNSIMDSDEHSFSSTLSEKYSHLSTKNPIHLKFSPASAKVHRPKPKKNIISATHSPSKVSKTNTEHRNNTTAINRKFVKNFENCKYRENNNINYRNNIKQTFESKKVLQETDTNAATKTPPFTPPIKSIKIQQKFVKNSKISTASASPRRIYHKCATLATRLKTQSPVPSHQQLDKQKPNVDNNRKYSDEIDGVNMKNNTDTAGGIMRFAAFSRFKKIDFSPLKLKINNILQRPQSDF